MFVNPVLAAVQATGAAPQYEPPVAQPVQAEPQVVPTEQVVPQVEETKQEVHVQEEAEPLCDELPDVEPEEPVEEEEIDWSKVEVADRKSYFPDHLAIDLTSRTIKGACKGKPCELRKGYHPTTVFIPKLDLTTDYGKMVAQGLWAGFAKNQIQKMENEGWQLWGSDPDSYPVPYANDEKLEPKVREFNVWEFMTLCVVPTALEPDNVLAALYPVTEDDWKAWCEKDTGGWWEVFRASMILLGKDAAVLDKNIKQYKAMLSNVHAPLRTKPEVLQAVTARLEAMRESQRTEIKELWEANEGERFYRYHMAKLNAVPDAPSELLDM